MKEKKQVSYRPKKRRGRAIIPIITLTALTALLSAGIAGVWQLADATEYITPEMVASQTAPRLGASPPAEETPSADTLPEPGSEGQSSEDQAASSQSAAYAVDIAAYEVAKGEWVGTDYFDDALFVGDSITEGIKIYDVMSNTTVLSYTGINLNNIFTREVIKSGDSKLTIIDAARNENPAKIYVMMGANSMGFDKETFVKEYGKLVDALVEMHPQAIVYVQSILPVTETYAKNRPEFSNERIDDYNLGLRQMARDKGLPYLDVADAFKNENGALPDDASPKDGMHFGASWYLKWFDYLREHTLQGEG